MNIALLIIDVQEAFIGQRRGEQGYSNTFEYINETAALFRKAHKPVIIVRDIEGGDDENFQNVKELNVEDSDIEVLKEFSNSFWRTNLEEILKERNVDFVVLCGNAAEHCVLATYNGADERGYGVAMLQNGIFALHPNGLLDIFNNRSVISYQVISYMLNNL
ncbi:isochorismatase family protein [Alkaliphilus peptidifermentans]|uniref:Nicotinamidase-related amidase n=1 Tax=Alkaliphilus peptidifermentans DSM 18978 TaxID=1120976 RepID=A0A1G5H9V1_9FIRM|nr:isochorismatase family protein [Alkaliphilus peptidifermentans]SCY60655.1 Nicotinamidase-related amidase [Alkaliphilus peptidifermentans DSM 18978]